MDDRNFKFGWNTSNGSKMTQQSQFKIVWNIITLLKAFWMSFHHFLVDFWYQKRVSKYFWHIWTTLDFTRGELFIWSILYHGPIILWVDKWLDYTIKYHVPVCHNSHWVFFRVEKGDWHKYAHLARPSRCRIKFCRPSAQCCQKRVSKHFWHIWTTLDFTRESCLSGPYCMY